LNGRETGTLTSVKRSLFRSPAAIASGAAVLGALLVVNVIAIARGVESPWMLGAAVIADIVAVGLGVLIATREVMVAERRTVASDARLAAILESAMDAVITVDATQHIVLFNRTAEQLFACRRDDALGSPLERFIPARFRAAHHVHIDKFGTTGATSRRMGDTTTLWALRTDGSEFPIEASISHASDGGSQYYTVILRDITVRKQSEDALKRSQQELRDLSALVLEAREEEKTRIARELHDELGQLLTALKMDLAWLRERLPAGDAEIAAKAGQMHAMLEQTVSSTRRIAADLRPLMLDDLGLADAAGWLVSDFSTRSGVHCEIQMPGSTAFAQVEGSIATAIYRALQESLTNIARHSGAKNVRILLAIDNGLLRLEVEDDGRGIAPEDLSQARSLGLKGMRERIAFLGGSLEVARGPRGGTRLRARVPVRAAAREANVA
jgi:PAS domain S-box-containing protein